MTDEKMSTQNRLRELLLKAMREPLSPSDALAFAITINLLDLVLREIGEERVNALWREAVLGFKQDAERHAMAQLFMHAVRDESKHAH